MIKGINYSTKRCTCGSFPLLRNYLFSDAENVYF